MDGNKITQKVSSFLAKFKVGELKFVKKVIVTVVGMTVLVIGIAMIVLPGPAIVVIPAGLTILASEYSWAQRWLKKAKDIGSNLVKEPSRFQRFFIKTKELSSKVLKKIVRK
jgi:uncharacterized protein (TIGR02611 family)